MHQLQTSRKSATAINSSDIRSLNFEIPPSTDEQSFLAQIIETADVQMRTLEEYRLHLLQQKRALMQRLLTGEVRVAIDDELPGS